MTDLLLLVADVLLLSILLLQLSDFIYKRQRLMQERWFRVRRKVLRR